MALASVLVVSSPPPVDARGNGVTRANVMARTIRAHGSELYDYPPHAGVQVCRESGLGALDGVAYYHVYGLGGRESGPDTVARLGVSGKSFFLGALICIGNTARCLYARMLALSTRDGSGIYMWLRRDCVILDTKRGSHGSVAFTLGILRRDGIS